jgi:hypothetical protein
MGALLRVIAAPEALMDVAKALPSSVPAGGMAYLC